MIELKRRHDPLKAIVQGVMLDTLIHDSVVRHHKFFLKQHGVYPHLCNVCIILIMPLRPRAPLFTYYFIKQENLYTSSELYGFTLFNNVPL